MSLEEGQHLHHYRLVEKIGEGGMGVVWKALDTELNRQVAVKILPAELTSDEERRLRFRREAQTAAALSHPNIAVIYQVGEEAGCPFIAMELVRGRSLRDRLASGPMTARDLIKVALPVAEGLAHAHSNGVVHRDLKPDNIMITAEGQVKILDFGLAKLLQPGEGPGGAGTDGQDSRLHTISRELTRAGKVFGTVAYMSPEQARGEAVDHRSDLFSFGVMLYEMASARLPFKARSDVETLNEVIATEPVPLGEAAPEVPPELERIVRKAMQKQPEDRYQTAGDIAVDLRNLGRDLDTGRASIPSRPASGVASRPVAVTTGTKAIPWWALVAVAGIVAGIVALWGGWRGEEDAPPAGSAPAALTSVAVLPFESAGGDEDAAYLGDGITESVINGLSKIGGLRVVPRSVVFAWKGRAADPAEAGRELDVAAIVTGRVSRRGDELVVAAELIDVASVAQVWGDRYTRNSGDILDVQEAITREIAHNLRITVTADEEKKMTQRPTDNPAAYDAYLRGQGLAANYTQADLESAQRYFFEALEIDPDYALALAGLATVEAQLYRNEDPDPARLERAKGYAQRALEIDPDLARAHGALGEIYTVQYLYREAVPEFEAAIRLDPQEPTYHDNLSWALAYRTPPDGPAAERAAREAIRLSPTFSFAYYHLGRALIAQGRLDEARQAFIYGAELGKSQETMALGLGQVSMAEGDYAEALRRFEAHPAPTPLHQVYLAAALAGLQQNERSLLLLEKAAEGGYGDADFLEATPWFDGLRGDPRFRAVLEKVQAHQARAIAG